jgi:molybdopterin synthase catalytic subunit
MPVFLHDAPFDPWQELQTCQESLDLRPGSFGATDIFMGTMRDFNEGDDVQAMTLQHYPGMTEKHLEAIIDEARQRFGIDEALIIHRVGDIHPADTIVITAVWSAHRKAAFDANRFLMEELKHRAPFWKKETLADGSDRWVEKNTPG